MLDEGLDLLKNSDDGQGSTPLVDRPSYQMRELLGLRSYLTTRQFGHIGYAGLDWTPNAIGIAGENSETIFKFKLLLALLLPVSLNCLCIDSRSPKNLSALEFTG